jgi:GT2 family glycosyltransferase/glycosyltransferase involved in cell wall biosynthesis
MTLEKTRRRLRLLRHGLTTIAAIYRQDRHPRRLAGTIWFVTTRQGLIGLRHWLIQAAPPGSLGPAPTPDGLTVSPEARTQADPDAERLARAAAAERLYQVWLERYDLLREPEIGAARRHLAALDLPELLILAVVRAEDLPTVGRMVASWQAQLHPGWRAIIVGSADLSTDDIRRLRAATADDPSLSVVTTPAEIAAVRARAAFTLLAFGTPQLHCLSAYMFLEAAIRTGAAVVYSDHDRLMESGARADPAFKPQYSPEYLARYNYIGDCLLLSRAVSITPDDMASLPRLTLAEYDRLVARLVLSTPAPSRHIEHVPFPLFHVLREQPRARHDLPLFADTGPTVAIIIPTQDGLAHLRPCIDSIFEKTSYDPDRVEIIIVDNDSRQPETLDYLKEIAARPRVSIVRYPRPFNFAEINNIGAEAATSEVLIFLNNDTIVHDPAWLSKLVAYADQPGVGMVGAKLLFPDGTIQHGGCVAGASLGTVQHLLRNALSDDVANTDHTREISVVTGACIAVHRRVFQQIGGFDPILRVTWNDVKACLECLGTGLRNIYIADPLLIHDESKTREPDTTRELQRRYFSEADYTRRRFRDYFHDDPSYNPNLSVDKAGDLAEPPRVRRPWFRPAGGPLRILLLSIVYKVGYGVPVVIQQHARKLIECGYEVVIGGPLADNELSFPGCERVVLSSAQEAAVYAFSTDIALVVSHTPPFFEVPIMIGGHIPVLAYDYGEPAAEFFQDPTRSYLLNVGYQKRAAAALTTTLATISQSVKNETLNQDALVLGLANSHLPAWSEALRPERDRARAARDWQQGFVILTVCRFHENERAYKGLDKIAMILREFPYLYPEASKRLIWVLAGAGSPSDVAQAEQLGFTVFPNVADDTLADLYKAADAYMGFSKWEGYNLGISQALAMGLPTLGSDIPAHREFGIPTTNSVLVACEWLAAEVERRAAATPGQRIATVYDWDRSATAFVALIEEMLRQSAAQKSRGGASGAVWQDLANSG